VVKLVTEPKLLVLEHDLSRFDSGVPVLDDWLRLRAFKNAFQGASKTYVTCAIGTNEVAGFYSLSAAQIQRSEVSGNLARNMPADIPCALLGRMAVDQRFRRNGLARAMLLHAIGKTQAVAQIIAVRALVVHAINDDAATYYQKFGFKRLPVTSATYALDLLDFADLPLSET
jgi:GNAT superfamily N-acetyltransferase